jgi:hypothetical protein
MACAWDPSDEPAHRAAAPGLAGPSFAARGLRLKITKGSASSRTLIRHLRDVRHLARVGYASCLILRGCLLSGTSSDHLPIPATLPRAGITLPLKGMCEAAHPLRLAQGVGSLMERDEGRRYEEADDCRGSR